MASESTIAAEQSAPPEQVDKVDEEVKKIEQEDLLPSVSKEQEKMKSEESPCQPELEEKMEDKQIELSLAEEVNKTDDQPDTSSVLESVADSTKSLPEDQLTIEPVEQQAQEKPNIEAVEKLPEGAPKMWDDFELSGAADSAKSQPEDQPTVESVENQPPQEQPALEKQPEEAPKLGDVTKSVVADGTKIQPEERPPSEYIEKQLQEQVPVEVVENQLEEQQKIGDTSEPPAEAVVKAEPDEVLLVKESETAVVKDSEKAEVEPERKEEISEPVPKEEDKPQEQPEASEQVEKECAEIDPKESVKVDIGKEEESLADKIEEQTTKEEVVAKESSDQSTQTIVGDQVDKKDDGEEIPPAAVTESANVDDKERELSGIDVVELSKEEAAEAGGVELENEGKNVNTEEKKKVVTEGSDEPEGHKVEDVSSSISPNEIAEKSLEGENTPRDVDLVAENEKESTKKDEIVSSVKTEENGEIEEKVEESQNSVAEVKGGEAVQAKQTNLETEKEASEIAKPDLPKEEVSKKPTKQSNNIMAKVKQSLVKAKKAIIGKSPNSKPGFSETKGDIKDK